MIKVGKILEIREIFLIFFDFGWGFWIFGSTRSNSEHSECGGKEKGGSGWWGGAFGSL